MRGLGALLLLIARCTDKFYQPQMTIIIESGRWEEGWQRRNRRLLVMRCVSIFYVLMMVLFGKTILGMYGPGFSAAYPALLLISLAASVWTVCSPSPDFLRFVGQTKGVVLMTGAGVALLIGLCAWLGWAYGATGTAAGFLIASILTAGSQRVLAVRHFKRQMAIAAKDEGGTA